MASRPVVLAAVCEDCDWIWIPVSTYGRHLSSIMNPYLQRKVASLAAARMDGHRYKTGHAARPLREFKEGER